MASLVAQMVKNPPAMWETWVQSLDLEDPLEEGMATQPILSAAKLLQSCLTLETPWTVAHQLLCPWDFPGKNTGVGSHSLLQGIFPTQE